MPLSDLEVVSEELLEAEKLATRQIGLFQARLPLADQFISILLCEGACHCDVGGSDQHITLHCLVLAVEHARADDPLLLLSVQTLQQRVRSSLPQDTVIDLFFEFIDCFLFLFLEDLEALHGFLDLQNLRPLLLENLSALPVLLLGESVGILPRFHIRRDVVEVSGCFDPSEQTCRILVRPMRILIGVVSFAEDILNHGHSLGG